MEENEVWKTIEGYNGKYQVSTLGRVKSVERTIINCRGRKQSFKETILRPDHSPNGYERVGLYKNGRLKHQRVAKLVYEAFASPIPKGKEIDHLNGNNRDNRLENLRVCTHKENCRNPITRERHKAANEARSKKMKEYWSKKKVSSAV